MKLKNLRLITLILCMRKENGVGAVSLHFSVTKYYLLYRSYLKLPSKHSSTQQNPTSSIKNTHSCKCLHTINQTKQGMNLGTDLLLLYSLYCVNQLMVDFLSKLPSSCLERTLTCNRTSACIHCIAIRDCFLTHTPRTKACTFTSPFNALYALLARCPLKKAWILMAATSSLVIAETGVGVGVGVGKLKSSFLSMASSHSLVQI
ncbi:hypothetical protein V8G54_002922, partial [Vigna mungo]